MARLIGKGRYVLGEQLGVGGMGTVYAAEDLACTTRVAIKVAHAESVAAAVVAKHMERELRCGRAIAHPNVVRVLDGGDDAGLPFVVMELASGRALGVVAAEDRMSVRRAAAIVDQILAGLAAIHRAGYLHGDVKTDNVIVARSDDGSDVVKLVDLGLACERGGLAPTNDDGHVISGTPDYMAPELARGGTKTVASELYAVGVILYELLTGTTPFGGGTTLEILQKHVEDEVIPPSLRSPELDLSLELERVVLRTLDKDPAQRYATAEDFRSALRTAMLLTRDTPLATREHAAAAPTLEWTRPEISPSRLDRDPGLVVEAALAATQAHLRAHRLAAARDELEAAIRLIDGDASGERVLWRLLLALSAICDGLREPRRARRVARQALDSAARAGSEVGRRRAQALIERFAGHRAA